MNVVSGRARMQNHEDVHRIRVATGTVLLSPRQGPIGVVGWTFSGATELWGSHPYSDRIMIAMLRIPDPVL